MKANGNKKILITGGQGQLGKDFSLLLNDYNFETLSLSSSQLDITNLNNFFKIAKEFKPDIIINCAAYTKVDDCETNFKTAYRVNSLGAKNCAIISDYFNSILVHFSTDYIFSGNKNEPYLEFDQPSPISKYGESKYYGEILIKEHCSKFYIFRIAGVYGKYGNNFVKTIIKLSENNDTLKVVNDQITTPTYTIDICRQVIKLLNSYNFGIYHATSEGYCSWYEFTKEIFKLLNIKTHIIPCSTEEFPRPAKRPKFSALENFNLKILGLNKMKHWKISLKNFLRSIQ